MRLAIKMVKVLVGYPGKICHRIPGLFANCFVRFRARLTDCVCRGILKLHVEMLSVNTVRLLLPTYLQFASSASTVCKEPTWQASCRICLTLKKVASKKLTCISLSLPSRIRGQWTRCLKITQKCSFCFASVANMYET